MKVNKINLYKKGIVSIEQRKRQRKKKSLSCLQILFDFLTSGVYLQIEFLL